MIPEPRFNGHLVIQQRVLPRYRVPFFERLAADCARLTVMAGMPRPQEAIVPAQALDRADWLHLKNRHIAGGAFYLLAQPDLIPSLESLSPNVLVLEANPRYLTNWRAQTWAKAAGIPVLGWGLGAEAAGWATSAMWRLFLRGFDGMIAYSSRGTRAYQRFGVPADRVVLALNAAGPPPRAPASPRTGSVGRLRVLYVGRLQRRKRIDTLLQACSTMAGTTAVTIVGDGPERAALESLASTVLPEAHFTGHLEGPRLEEAFSDADLFVLPGTGGLAVQQAMAHGLAVVVGEGDGTSDDLVRPENGWRTSPGDAQHLAEIIKQAAGDRGRLAAMGAASYRIVSEEVNLDTMAQAFVKAITYAVGGG